MHRWPRAFLATLVLGTVLTAPSAQAESPGDSHEKAWRSTVRSSAFGAPAKLGPCTVYPSVLHPRHSKPGYIGPKPYTRCEVRVTSIRQVTELVYEWFAWWKHAIETSGGNRGEKSYTSKAVEYQCKGSESTVWAGATAGTVAYMGHTYYARVWQKQVRLPCGA